MKTKEEMTEEILEEYREFCKQTEEECMAEGWPSRGNNYELRCEQEWRDYYLPTIEAIEEEYA